MSSASLGMSFSDFERLGPVQQGSSYKIQGNVGTVTSGNFLFSQTTTITKIEQNKFKIMSDGLNGKMKEVTLGENNREIYSVNGDNTRAQCVSLGKIILASLLFTGLLLFIIVATNHWQFPSGGGGPQVGL